jgi:hypothetical protein
MLVPPSSDATLPYFVVGVGSGMRPTTFARHCDKRKKVNLGFVEVTPSSASTSNGDSGVFWRSFWTRLVGRSS